MITVGPNSANPNRQLYNDYYKAFAPSIGLSWAIPYFGANKTVLRAGWAWSRPLAQSFLTIDGAVPNFGTSATVSSVAPTFLNQLSLPLSPTFTNPLQTWPINDKTQSISAYDPNFMPPVVQNLMFRWNGKSRGASRLRSGMWVIRARTWLAATT